MLRGRIAAWTATATSRSARTATTSRPFIGTRPVLPRGRTPGCRGRSGATSSTSARSLAGREVDRPLVEVPGRRTVGDRRAHRRPRRRADPGRRHHPGRHRLDPERPARRPARPPRPRRPHRAAVRRADRPRRARRRHRHPQDARPRQGRDHLRPGHPAPLRLPRREPGRRVPAGRLRERPSGHRPGGLLRVDQRHHRGRPPRPVRLGDRRRPLLVRRAAGRPTSPAAPCTPPRARRSSSCPRPPPAGTVSRIRATLTPGSMVTTLKNTVDHVVTEHGVAEMRGRSISQRAAALIAIADPAVPGRASPRGPAARLPLTRSSDLDICSRLCELLRSMDVFEALADPTATAGGAAAEQPPASRRRAGRRRGHVTAGDEPAPEDAARRPGIVEDERVPDDARLRVFRLRPQSLVAVQAFLDQLQAEWNTQLRSFKRHVEAKTR